MAKPLIKAVIVDDIDSEAGQQIGVIEFREWHDKPGEVAGIGARCPCGCGSELWLPVHRQGETPRYGTSWEWNGEREGVVLSPSVFNTGLPCRWHGYLGQQQPGHWDEC